jgi:hypothetical protein
VGGPLAAAALGAELVEGGAGVGGESDDDADEVARRVVGEIPALGGPSRSRISKVPAAYLILIGASTAHGTEVRRGRRPQYSGEEYRQASGPKSGAVEASSKP